jgi:hypothetical protein
MSAITAERFDVSVRGHEEERIVETDMLWNQARSWCRSFNSMMKGSGVVAVPHLSAPLLGNALGEVGIDGSVKLSRSDVGMP